MRMKENEEKSESGGFRGVSFFPSLRDVADFVPKSCSPLRDVCVLSLRSQHT